MKDPDNPRYVLIASLSALTRRVSKRKENQMKLYMLTGPDGPNIGHCVAPTRALHPPIHSKLLSEYVMAVRDDVDVRLAVTMAALYSGAVGPALEAPFNFVAKNAMASQSDRARITSGGTCGV